ncbi:acid protease [Didymella exigua CBS 183.55]|uniref:Acid protease n=1 Tax=Didymella exigua CBS 183.55 TaxID=1150837 RepID=A0A6A5RHJ7_9PLEO|nr:acid protease [Didymella exigua CBS 183.55]KAF1926720.1 acid protease [Didymella exigua CBS 183.55]
MKTAGMLAAATAAAASVVELPVRIKDTYCTAEVSVGTPPKPYRLLFDTGSSTSWFTSTACTATSCPYLASYNRTLYSANASSTSTDLHSFSRISYVDGDGVAGAATRDVFSAPDGSFEWNQTFLSANESSWRWITADGYLGLGFSSIAENATTTLVETLLWDGQLDEPRFSLFYGTNLENNGTQNGVLTIGGSHEDKYVDGEIVYAPLKTEDPHQLWRAPLRSVNILVAGQANSTVITNTGSLPHTTDANGTFPQANTTWQIGSSGIAVFDTGAGRVSVPSSIIDVVYYNLGWNFTKLLHGEERIECQHLNASWALTFTLGEDDDTAKDVSFSIRGDEFIEPGSECMPPIDTSDQGNFALVGSPFLQRYYTIWDFGADKVADYAPKIGFGKLKKEWDYLYQ